MPTDNPPLCRVKVARKLVLMEGDLERSEEKVELSERYLMELSYFLYPLFCLLFFHNLFKSKQALNKITNVTPISNLLHLSSLFSKIVELEEELRVVGNNLKSLEVSEEKVCPLVFHPLLTLQSFQRPLQNLVLNLQTVRIFY